ncbi:MAG: indole-3-glycerol phosphate synthase TrpC [Proteobacteria bacterium]|nr:indole-3-glycerol phosphate synthase TrpC [Pseudomonadota bacterium]MBU4469480.1 indole-3-glycerol phosphate synthase TrpC [Pseudomonadota bacterium]MCG2752379.1 indole-3-glycerol phosphate synthase TrpC [Desulfobacteraceae bacterium]
MTDFLTKIIETKKEEVLAARKRVPEQRLRQEAENTGIKRPFEAVLEKPGPYGANIIAEIKRASPSKGMIKEDLDAEVFSRHYEAGGAAAISVLTDTPYFKGSLEDLVAAKRSSSLPVLRKEFIISTYQIYEAAAAGADAVLLIVRILSPKQLKEYMQLCRELGLGALVEIHDPKEVETAVDCQAKIIGINNRDLSSFHTDLQIAVQTASLLGPGQVPVAASGIHSREDIQTLKKAGIFNFLIGESIVRSNDPEGFLKSLLL